MADSKVKDYSAMKVVDLRKELRSRSLSCAGDKSTLVKRLKAALRVDANEQNVLSDSILDDEGGRHDVDLLDDTAVDNINEDLVLDDEPLTDIKTMKKKEPFSDNNEMANDPDNIESKKPKLRLKVASANLVTSTTSETNSNLASTTTPVTTNNAGMTSSVTESENLSEIISPTDTTGSTVTTEKSALTSISATTAKISTVTITSTDPKPEGNSDKQIEVALSPDVLLLKTPSKLDTKTKLELRAKRFGLPVKVNEIDKKEARQNRFKNSSVTKTESITTDSSIPSSNNIEKLRNRAQRFGQTVSKVMSDLEYNERMERRKAKFGDVK